MTILTLTYNKHKSPEVIRDAIDKNIRACYSPATARDGSWRLLHVMSYKTLFLIPEPCLEHGRVYSIEDICSYQKGLINSVALHDFLDSVGRMKLEDSDVLKRILEDATTPEMFSLMDIPVFDVYCALCAAYFLETGATHKYTEILKVANTRGINKYQKCYEILTE